MEDAPALTDLARNAVSDAPRTMSGPPVQDLGSAQLRSRNPLLLNANQEKEVREIYHTRVRDKCRAELQGTPSYLSSASCNQHAQADGFWPAWAHCCQGRTFTVTWACREQRRIMNACMLDNANQHEKDAAREQWFQRRLQKAEERVKAQEKEKQEKDMQTDRPMSMMVPARSSSELK